jgi:hypothetical protein
LLPENEELVASGETSGEGMSACGFSSLKKINCSNPDAQTSN